MKKNLKNIDNNISHEKEKKNGLILVIQNAVNQMKNKIK